MAAAKTSKREKKKEPRGSSPLLQLSGTRGELIGVLIAVVAVAMGVALSMNSSAPVSHAVSHVLVLLFGSGAMLLPVALLMFALMLLIDKEAVTKRMTCGILLVTLSVLAIISITTPEATAHSEIVLAQDVLMERGGYIGGVFAWIFLVTLGREVGIVVLTGVILVGIVICGFSFSDAIAQLKAGVNSAAGALYDAGSQMKKRRGETRERRLIEPLEPIDGGAGFIDDGFDPVIEPPTSYIGSRTSTVLTRNIAAQQEQQAGASAAAPVYDPPTLRRPSATESPRVGEKLTRGKGGRKSSNEVAWQEEIGRVGSDVTELDESTLPDFLVGAQPRRAKTRKPSPRNAQGRPHTLTAKPTVTPVAAPLVPLEDAAVATGAAAEAAGAVADAASTAAQAPAKPRRKASAKRAAASKEQVSTSDSRGAQQVSDANVKLSNRSTIRRPGDGDETYNLPPLSMLSSNPQSASSASTKAEIERTMDKLQGTLREFGLKSRVVDYVSGPLVTTFRVEMGEGERVNKIRNLEDDIALTLAAVKVRIFAPIPGTSYVGIEIPNKTRQNVHLGDVLPYAQGGPLEVAIGRDSAGKPVIADIAKMPHMLVAGTTGSGKSVMINSMIMSLLLRATPKQVRLIMVDPKRVEFKGYNGIPHLYVPVVTEPRQAASALQWAVSEMERRLKVFEHAGARNITAYNKMCTSGKLSQMDNPPEPMPYLVIVIDELSDLMMVAGKDVEASIVRIAQLARAAGIHLVIATQRPSANVVTGLIKSNIDSRVALKVSSGIDSRVILDETGADRLLGNGDMLFKDRGLAPMRVLGCYTSDEEIESVVDFIRDQGEPDYHEEILSAVVPGQPGAGGSVDDEDDPLVWEAAQIVVESQLGSTSGLQRRLKVGYARAGRIMDMLEAKGIVGPASGSKPREVLLNEDELEDLRVQDEKYREV